jgi:hypothetical protein
MTRITTIFACACAMLALAAPVAFAQSSTEDAYEGLAALEDVGGGSNGSENPGSAANTADDGGTLPFTGLELSLFALVGVALVGGGYAVRRVSRGPAGA